MTAVMEAQVPYASQEAIRAEQAVLGSAMIEAEACDKAAGIIELSDFYRPTDALIFDAIKDAIRQDGVCDLITVTNKLRDRKQLDEVGGVEYLMACLERVPTAKNVEHYAKIVKRASMRRKATMKLAEYSARLRSEEDIDPVEIIEACQAELDAIASDTAVTDIVFMGDVYNRLYETLGTGDYEKGIPIKLKALERISVSIRPGELLVIGARPRIGKSALAFELLMHAAKHGYPAAVISCEMESEQFAWREIARQSGVNLINIFTNNLQDIHFTKIADAISGVWKLPVYYVDAQGWNMDRIQAVSRRLVAKGVKIIAIDHLQLVRPTNLRADRRVQLGQISGDCKNMARKLKIPVLALCQLSRAADKRGGDSRPTLADLKESGDIEANADAVWLLWRKLGKGDGEKQPPVTEAEIIVAKNRMLPEGVAHVGWYGRKFSFEDIEERQQDPKASTGQGKLVV